MDNVVIRELEKRLGSVKLGAASERPFHHQCLAAGEFFDFLVPLVFQRGGRNDQHAFDAGSAGEDFRGGYGLDRLAQAHVVGDQTSSGLGGKQGTFALVRIKRHFQQFFKRLAMNAAGKHFA